MKTPVIRYGMFAVSLLLPLVFSCSGMKVHTESPPTADLSRYKTYAWAPRPAPIPGRVNRSDLEQVVETETEKVLAKKGLTPAKDGAAPDLVLRYVGMSKYESRTSYKPDQAPSMHPYAFYPHSNYYGGYQGGEQSYAIHEGTLSMEFLDSKSNQVVWKGTAEDVIENAGATTQQVRAAVEKLVEEYPTG